MILWKMEGKTRTTLHIIDIQDKQSVRIPPRLPNPTGFRKWRMANASLDWPSMYKWKYTKYQFFVI